jgi:BCCT, betaine/carnitine/choline family transporter
MHRGSESHIDVVRLEGVYSIDYCSSTLLVSFHRVTIAAGIGTFIATISQNRKLWEIVFYCFVATSSYCLIWFCICGGIGLRQSRQGKELAVLGERLFNDSAYYLTDGSDYCYDVPQNDVFVDNQVVFTNRLPGVTPVCAFNASRASLDVLHSFSFPDTFGEGRGMGRALSALYLLGIAIYFIASSDSATLVVDSLASNGRKNYHWARRMFWASTIGAVTTALLSSGGGDSMSAIQAASYMFGLPIAILMCFLLQSTTLLCRAAVELDRESDYLFPNQPEFGMPIYGGIFNCMEYLVSLGKVNPARVELGMHQVTRLQRVEFVKGIFVPFVSLNQILARAYPMNRKTNAVLVACYAAAYLSWIGLFVMSWTYAGLEGVAVTAFFIAGFMLAMIRAGFRSKYNLRSNTISDVIASSCFWPQVFAQMQTFLNDGAVGTKANEDNGGDQDRSGSKKGVTNIAADSERSLEI